MPDVLIASDFCIQDVLHQKAVYDSSDDSSESGISELEKVVFLVEIDFFFYLK